VARHPDGVHLHADEESFREYNGWQCAARQRNRSQAGFKNKMLRHYLFAR
jgi:hypothetical protein